LELMRCIRSQADSLIGSVSHSEMAAMALGLAHSLGRYKLKFSPDKVDTMIVQAVSLLDDLDKELNNYIMRCKEWYSWHFPEVSKLIQDNLTFIKVIKLMGMRQNCKTTDFSELLPEDMEEKLKEAAEISMGTEISEDDIDNITLLADEVLQISEYRSQLYEYLKNRMMAIAPNLTILVGELVGARLIAHAGSLLNLAKHPASTVQILGAEKALFRALKTKKDTPKYGLIYHAQLVGQASTKLKGKASRMLAAKAALAARVDALGEETSIALGTQHRAYLESRMRILESGDKRAVSATKKKFTPQKYDNKSEVRQYQESHDSTVKRKVEEDPAAEETEEVPKKKKKKDKKRKSEASEDAVAVTEEFEVKQEPTDEQEEEEEVPKKKKKKGKKVKTEPEDD